MTIDFRPPEERGDAPKAATGRAGGAPAAQRLVLKVLLAAATLFIGAGLFLLVLHQPAFLGPQSSVFLGVALLLSGVFDIAVAVLLKRLWARAKKSRTRR